VRAIGLTVDDAGYFDGAFEFSDQATMLRGQRSGQVTVLAERAAGVKSTTDAIINAFAPYRTASGATGSKSSGGTSPRRNSDSFAACGVGAQSRANRSQQRAVLRLNTSSLAVTRRL
jgi:hypothetical protein